MGKCKWNISLFRHVKLPILESAFSITITLSSITSKWQGQDRPNNLNSAFMEEVQRRENTTSFPTGQSLPYHWQLRVLLLRSLRGHIPALKESLKRFDFPSLNLLQHNFSEMSFLTYCTPKIYFIFISIIYSKGISFTFFYLSVKEPDALDNISHLC